MLTCVLSNTIRTTTKSAILDVLQLRFIYLFIFILFCIIIITVTYNVLIN